MKPEECGHHQEYLVVSNDGQCIECESCGMSWEQVGYPPANIGRAIEIIESVNIMCNGIMRKDLTRALNILRNMRGSY